jgi:hypothetical protein
MQQFAPGSSLEVLITSADSRIRVVNGDELVHKFKGNASFSCHLKSNLVPFSYSYIVTCIIFCKYKGGLLAL